MTHLNFKTEYFSLGRLVPTLIVLEVRNYLLLSSLNLFLANYTHLFLDYQCSSLKQIIFLTWS